MCKARHWAAASGLRRFPVAAMRQAAIGHRKLNFEPRKWQPNNGEQNHNYKNLSKCNSVLSQFVKKSKLGTTIVVRPIVTTAPGTVNSSYRCQSLCQLMALERVFPLSFVSLTIQRIQTQVWVSQKFSSCPCQIQMFATIGSGQKRMLLGTPASTFNSKKHLRIKSARSRAWEMTRMLALQRTWAQFSAPKCNCNSSSGDLMPSAGGHWRHTLYICMQAKLLDTKSRRNKQEEC